MRQATRADLVHLVALMSEFYAESGYPVDAERATKAFDDLVSDERLGGVWLLQSSGDDVGYLVLTLGYSMEYGGFDAFVDDLFIRAPFRGTGLGTAALEAARRFCLDRGVRALHLEVERENPSAQRLYRKLGFQNNERQLLTLRLASPLHAV